MIMMLDKKKIVNQIMGDKDEGEETSPLHTMVEELIQGIQAGDVEGTCEALRAAVYHIYSEYNQGE